MPFDLTRLGSERFEHLVQALAIGAIGPGVQVFGAGPDGGREATFKGTNEFEGKGTWDGYGVIQAKYKSRLLGTQADQSWFFEQVTAELDHWIAPRSRRLAKPKYLVIATNVPMSAVAEGGGIDRLDRLIEQYRTKKDDKGRLVGLPDLVDYDLWHAERIDRLIDANADVRRRYADLVLPGDVISRLYETLGASEEKLAQAWIGHVSRSLRADTTVELGESGDHANAPLALADIAVDLPIQINSKRGGDEFQTALASLVARGDNVLSNAMKPAHRDRLVVLGGPGTGKSTLSKLLCQIYRAALLLGNAADRITSDTQHLATTLRDAFDNGGLPTPTLHRLPVRVDLGAYADAVSRPGALTLLEHITATINARASEHLTVGEMKALMTKWPSLVVLDGLDEVAPAEIRIEVAIRIEDFLEEMAATGADVLTVCTSRPSGFDLGARIKLDEMHLAPLQEADALRYAGRLVSQRFPNNPEREHETLERLAEAAKGTDTGRLMTSPLQVTILALILEQRTRAPSSRFALFNAYYDTIYARERNKPGGHGELLETHRALMNQLHQRCALTIHARAERAGQAESILPNDELSQITRHLLETEGYPREQIDALLTDILALAQQRLVLLVARGDGIAFEVRSLAEFFAARALMSDVDAVDHLAVMVPSAHWRNTWLLAAGYIFVERTELRDAVIAVLDRVDNESLATRLVQPGSLLAVDALSDGFAAHAPKYEKHLALHALRLLDGPIGAHVVELAEALGPLMIESEQVLTSVKTEVNVRLAQPKIGATRAFLSTLEDVAPEAVAMYASNRLADYDTATGGMAPRQILTSSAENERRRIEAQQKLIDMGIDSELIPPPDQLEQGLRHTDDGTDATGWVRPAREIIVEAVSGDVSVAHTARNILSQMIEHDDVSRKLPLD